VVRIRTADLKNGGPRYAFQQDRLNRIPRQRRRGSDNQERGQLNGPVTRHQALLPRLCLRRREKATGQGRYESRTYWHRAVAWEKLATFAATLKKGAHLQLVGELRTREYEKEYGNKKKFTVKQRVCEVAVDSILKLDRAEKQDEPAPEVDPSELPADEPTA